MQTTMNRSRLLAGVAILLFGSAAVAQPGNAPERERPGREGQPERQPERDSDRQPARESGRQPEAGRPIAEQLSPERLRARLANLLGEFESAAERLRTAISMLDEGKQVGEVIDAMGGPMRARRLAELSGQWERPEGEVRERPGGEREGEQRGGAMRDIAPERILAFLRENAPELGERLGRLRGEDPRRADAFLGRFGPRVGEIFAARQHDPDLAEMLVQDFRLSMRLLDASRRHAEATRAGEAEQAEQAENEIRRIASAQVDLKLRRREHEIAALASQVERLREDIESQQADRETIIGEMVERATSPRSGWGGPEGDRRGGGEGRRGDRPGRTDRDG